LEVGAHLVISDFSDITIWNLNDWFPYRAKEWVLLYKNYEPEKEKLREVKISKTSGIFFQEFSENSS
jgi:hypothetical protein